MSGNTVSSTREDGRPAFLFYTQDWLCEPTLKVVSMGAKGLWIDVLCLMSRSPIKGYLLTPAGEPADIEWIGKQIGRPSAEIKPLWEELLRAGTPRIDSKNRVFSKRMIADKTLTEKRSEAGRLGGRPKSNDKANGKQNGNGETSLDNDNDNDSDTDHDNDKKDALPEALRTDSFRAAWSDWLKYRKETRHALTPSTIARQLKKLEKVGPAVAAAMIAQSIEHGWRGLFEVNSIDASRTLTGKGSASGGSTGRSYKASVRREA